MAVVFRDLVLRNFSFLVRQVLGSQPLFQKLDLGEVYPCPVCRHHSTIQGITLTEAFGCDRCQQIYVIRERGFGLEQLSRVSPYQRLWRWTGSQWRQQGKLPMSGWLLVIMSTVLVATLCLWLLLPISLKVTTLLMLSLAAWVISTSRR